MMQLRGESFKSWLNCDFHMVKPDEPIGSRINYFVTAFFSLSYPFPLHILSHKAKLSVIKNVD